jgi:hypothetical protein
MQKKENHLEAYIYGRGKAIVLKIIEMLNKPLER